MSNTAQTENDSKIKAARRRHFKELRTAIANEDAVTIANLLMRSDHCLATECENAESFLHKMLFAVPGLPEKINMQLAGARRDSSLSMKQLVRLQRLRRVFPRPESLVGSGSL